MALARLKGKIPKEIPFDLKRCESCRRAKQGAIVDRTHTAETARIQRMIAELFSIGKDAWRG